MAASIAATVPNDSAIDVGIDGALARTMGMVTAPLAPTGLRLVRTLPEAVEDDQTTATCSLTPKPPHFTNSQFETGFTRCFSR